MSVQEVKREAVLHHSLCLQVVLITSCSGRRYKDHEAADVTGSR